MRHPTLLSKLSLTLAVLTLVVLTACRPSTRMYVYQPVDPNGWSCQDTLRYELPMDSTSILRTFTLGVRFTEQQTYRGLWLVLEQRNQGHPPRRDTLYVPLAHENGRWEARGGVLHETEAVCTAAHTFPLQTTHLLVYHIMPQQEIRGFTAIGVKVE